MSCRRDATGNGSREHRERKAETIHFEKLAKRQSGNATAQLSVFKDRRVSSKFCSVLFCSIYSMRSVRPWGQQFCLLICGPRFPCASPWSALSTLHWRMLCALPALGGSANCLSTHQIVMSFVFDMLDVQNESTTTHSWPMSHIHALCM